MPDTIKPKKTRNRGNEKWDTNERMPWPEDYTSPTMYRSPLVDAGKESLGIRTPRNRNSHREKDVF